jgi:hypothetical protein
MKALIWKELRENLKFLPLPGLAILLVFLIDRPLTPMPGVSGAYFLCLIAVVFGAALGFLQIFVESRGDKRSLLLHRPIGRSRIFLAKAIAGVGLYVLALGIPFACMEIWFATPGKMPAPYHWRTGLPWLADILSGLVYYFAGMLTAQREERWYGSRILALAAAFFCSCLVWTMPEFGQAFLVIGIICPLVGVAAWGSFCAGGAYAPQRRLAKAALAMTFLAGLLIVSMLGKQMIGQWFDSGIQWESNIDRHGRVLIAPFKESQGAIGPWMDLSGQRLPELKSKVMESGMVAPRAGMETPLDWSYRNSGRFYIVCTIDPMPGQEIWYYDQTQGCLLGFDSIMHQSLGSFGLDGFTPAGEKPGKPFQGELRYRSSRWQAPPQHFLAFPDRVYTVNLGRRTIRTLFAPVAGETVTFARWWSDDLDTRPPLVVVSTDKSVHLLTEEGSPVVSVPRDPEKHKLILVGLLENPERYFVWYLPSPPLLEPEAYKTSPSFLHEYDVAGRELAQRTVPPPPYPAAPYAAALFGLVTPMTEAATLVGASQYLRSEARLNGSSRKPVLLDYLENSRYYIPGTAWFEVTPRGLIPGYIALVLLSAAACALGCFLLARRHAFSHYRCIGWAVLGFLFGWVGLFLMLALQDWPARIACPKCHKLRVVTRDRCEYCAALHAVPAPDGTEIFEPMAANRHVALVEG